MPETNYVANPRPNDITPPSRQFASDVYFGKFPAAPDPQTKPALTYNSSGQLMAWNPTTRLWVAVGSAFAQQPEDDMALDFFEEYSVGAISALDKGAGWLVNGVASGATIVSRTHVDGHAMKALSLLNGQIGRKMPWGDKWNRLRICIGVRLNAAATFNTVAGAQFLGVCSGTTNMAGSATTDNCIGYRWGSAAGEAITLTAGTRGNYFNVGTAFRFMSRRGNTITVIASGGSGHAVPAVEGNIGLLMLRIQRPVFANDSSSVNYVLLEGTPQASEIEFSRAKNAVRQILQDDAGSGSASTQDQNTGGFLTGTTTSAFDQSTGALDTFNVAWPETVNPLEIYCVGIRKLS